LKGRARIPIKARQPGRSDVGNLKQGGKNYRLLNPQGYPRPTNRGHWRTVCLVSWQGLPWKRKKEYDGKHSDRGRLDVTGLHALEQIGLEKKKGLLRQETQATRVRVDPYFPRVKEEPKASAI